MGTLQVGPDGSTPSLEVVPGTYVVTETTPPPGYAAAPPVTVTVAPVGSAGPQPQVVTVTDHALPGTIEVEKVDASTGDDVAEAVVSVTPAPVTPGPAAGRSVTTGSGPTPVAGLLPGRYLVRETAPPPGYLADAAAEVVELGPGQTLQVVLRDQRAPAPATTTTTIAPRRVASPPGPTRPASPLPEVPVPAPIRPASTLAFTGLPAWRLCLAGVAVAVLGLSLVELARMRRAVTAPAGAG